MRELLLATSGSGKIQPLRTTGGSDSLCAKLAFVAWRRLHKNLLQPRLTSQTELFGSQPDCVEDPVPDARGGDLLGRLTLQLGSLGAFPTRILRLPELLVRLREKRMRLPRLPIHFHRPAQFP